MTMRTNRPDGPGNRLESSACAILAGGRSRRMGGGAKAFLEVDGKPLLQHVIERARPQVGELALSVDIPSLAFERFSLPQVPDPEPGSNGPLGGLAAAMKWAVKRGYEWLLLLPCDAPFFPRDLATRLHAGAASTGAPIAVASDRHGLQQAFSLWNGSLLAELDRAVGGGMAGFRQFLDGKDFARVEWPDAADAFFNINDRIALEEARRIAAEKTGSKR